LNLQNTPIINNQKLSEVVIEDLFKKYFNALCVFARQYVYDNDKVKDIVHDVFINIWEKGALHDSESLIKGYLFTSVKNRCFNYLRDTKKFRGNEDIGALNHNAYVPNNNMELQELQQIINQAIDELPEKCKEIFMMSRYEMMKYQEIADTLGISVKTVEAQMSKALKVLRERVGTYTDIIILILILSSIK